MFYSYSKGLRQTVSTHWASATSVAATDSGPTDNQAAATDTSTAAAESVDRRLLTDGGEEPEDSDETGGEGSDEEMQPPEQEGEEGVDADEEADEEPQEAEADEEPEETEAEEDEGVVDVPQSDIESEGDESDESTTVLFLDIYGLDLDLLGLEIQLHQVVLDVFATEGDGNLLGNLLSSVAGLTDPGGLSNLMPDGISDLMPEDGLLPEGGILPEDGIASALGFGGEKEEGKEGDGEKGEESEGRLSSAARSIRESVPSLPIKQLLIEVIAGVIKQLLESPKEDASGEES